MASGIGIKFTCMLDSVGTDGHLKKVQQICGDLILALDLMVVTEI